MALRHNSDEDLQEIDYAGAGRTRPWYALHIRSNFEKKAALSLRQRGFEEFSPTYQSRSYWSDRVKLVQRPLLPGYIFCRFQIAQKVPVMQSPGIVDIVRFGGEPAPVEESEIESLRALVASGQPLFPRAFLHVGDRVVIRRGPLAGVEGILEKFQKGYRIVVSIGILQRSVTAEIDAEWVSAAPAASIKKMPALLLH